MFISLNHVEDVDQDVSMEDAQKILVACCKVDVLCMRGYIAGEWFRLFIEPNGKEQKRAVIFKIQ